VVEDNETQAHLLKLSLTRRGFSVYVSATLAHALQVLKDGGIDVILLDLSLPDSEGIQTFYDVYAESRGVPVVVLTGLNDQRVAYTALKSGAQDYLVKGIPSDESVERCLRYAIQRQQFETDLWQSERRTRLILEHATDAFFATDEAGIVLTWNAEAERTFGYLRKDAMGQPLVGLIVPPAFRKAFNNELRRFVHGEREVTVNARTEMNLCGRDGNEFPAEMTLFSIVEDDNHMFCGFVRDVSNQKEMDEKMRHQLDQRLLDRMAEVERTNNDLQKYNRTITVDLRKRLELILQYALVLKWKLKDRPEVEVERALMNLCGETEKLINHVQPLADSDTHIHQSTIIRRASSPSVETRVDNVAGQQPI
jgi:PAS domain S-box-containing protein